MTKQQKKIVDLSALVQKNDSIIAHIINDNLTLIKSWGDLTSGWVEPDIRNSVIGHIDKMNNLTAIPVQNLPNIISLPESACYGRVNKAGIPNQHNGMIPKRHRSLPREKEPGCYSPFFYLFCKSINGTSVNVTALSIQLNVQNGKLFLIVIFP